MRQRIRLLTLIENELVYLIKYVKFERYSINVYR